MDDYVVAFASRGNVTVQFENLYEGYCGDYNPDDPNDENLLRFTVYMNGEEVPNASYCTQIPANSNVALVKKAAERILKEVYDPLQSGYGIKKLCETLSWISVN